MKSRKDKARAQKQQPYFTRSHRVLFTLNDLQTIKNLINIEKPLFNG